VFRQGRSAVLASSALAFACSKNDAISQAEEALNGGPGPSIVETRAIAEQGFVYRLPLVIAYAIMYEYSIATDSGQFKGPLNQIFNEASVFTYKDTLIPLPNSQC
jgi:hypothetical protein